MAVKRGAAARVTLKDVAAHAGVSFSTVSNVINNHSGDVGVETRERVLASIRALNYRPNVAARQLRNAHARVLALTIPNFANPYFSDVVGSIVQEAEALDRTVLIDYTRGERSEELLVVSGMRPHLIDGVILYALGLDLADVQPDHVPIPIVTFGENLANAPYDMVEIDNVAAARLAAEHLVRLGRRRIGFVGASDDPRNVPAHSRLQGYREALEAAGLPVDPRLIASFTPASFGRVNGMEGMQRLLTQGPPPDAVLCFNDLVALGAMKVLRDTGFRIPDDVGVVGIDDIEEGRFTTPALTTIAPDKSELGRLLVSLLVARIDGSRSGPPERFDPSFRLVVRQSTAG